MRRGRMFLMMGFVLLAVTVVSAILILQPAANSGHGAALTTATPPPPQESIVIAVQDIPRGSPIVSGSISTRPWPVNAIPEDAIRSGDLKTVIGKVARVDILREQPLLQAALSGNRSDLGGRGSDAALSIPNGMVAIAVPISRQSSVGYALQPGDHIDVLISYLFLDLDTEYQTRLPDSVEVPPQPGSTGSSSGSGGNLSVYGREETFLGQRVSVIPDKSDPQRPRLVSQVTVQNALVLHIGEYIDSKDVPVAAAPAEPTPTAQPQNGNDKATPAPAPPKPDLMTVAVSPQDALVLKYALDSKADIAFALRSPGDTAPAQTESVTLQYMMERFNIAMPGKLPYGFSQRLDDTQPASAATGQPDK